MRTEILRKELVGSSNEKRAEPEPAHNETAAGQDGRKNQQSQRTTREMPREAGELEKKRGAAGVGAPPRSPEEEADDAAMEMRHPLLQVGGELRKRELESPADEALLRPPPAPSRAASSGPRMRRKFGKGDEQQWMCGA
jgi:hypothetical protein